jgi:hypothetical protein
VALDLTSASTLAASARVAQRIRVTAMRSGASKRDRFSE